MRHFHHAQKREQQQTISHVTLNISAHTPQVLLNNSPFSFMFSLLYGFAIVPPPHFLVLSKKLQCYMGIFAINVKQKNYFLFSALEKV